jgi:hypothetical protein
MTPTVDLNDLFKRVQHLEADRRSDAECMLKCLERLEAQLQDMTHELASLAILLRHGAAIAPSPPRAN